MTATRPPLASVEQVREELRRLGYLDTGLGRFVLAGAGGPSPLAASLRAAWRVGIVGGVVFGVALCLAAAGLDRRLLDSPQDLAVLALYLVLLLGAATGVAAFLGGLAAGWYARRRERKADPNLSRNVGLVLAVSGLAYLALWWPSHALGASLALQFTAVVLGLGASVALGRFGFLAAVAVLSAGGLSDRLPEASLSRTRMLPVIALAATLFGAGVVAASYLGGRAEVAPPDFAVVPTGLRVRVLGVDGLDARLAEQMIARGELPRLRDLMASGARGRLAAEPEQVPAIVWTTIATGRGPEAHGIRSTGSRRVAGMRTPVPMGEESRSVRAVGAATDLLRLTRPQPPTSVLRGIKAFWNVASEKGLRVGVVNWWATWPADAVNGYVVTDRAFFKVEKGGGLDREVHPPEAFDRLKALSLGPEDGRARRLDRFPLESARALRGKTPPDVEALYLPGLDILTMKQLGEPGEADLATLDARLDAVKAHYRFVDALLGEIVDGLAPLDVLVLVGDPGRLARRSSQTPEGLLVLEGTPVTPVDLGRVSERDVAPTVLHLAGLPVSRELDGRVLEAAFTPEFRGSHPVRFVASYGRRPQARPAESGFDREMLEELRSLGYIRSRPR